MIKPLKSSAIISRQRKSIIGACLLLVLCSVAWVIARVGGTRPLSEQVARLSSPTARNRSRNLALQPAALGLGRRLGHRFLKPGREVTVLEGTLTTGADSRRVVVRRTQDEAGERVEVTVIGTGAPFTWDASGGTSRAGRPTDPEAAALAGRIALDGPDQFVLAQLRGASYLVVARNVRTDESGADTYSGPLHDVVRIGEPAHADGAPSAWRLYYLNTQTGLLDKVVSEEEGEWVEAALTGWAERGGEWQPSRITWSKGGEVFMEFAITNAAHGLRQ